MRNMHMGKERILAVDDEADILDLLRYNLKREGYDVLTVGSGEDCLDCAEKMHPDLILLDLMLPGIDGLSACRMLKENSKTKHIPVIMLTAKGEESDIVTGLELGADDYIPKPFSSRVLCARIKTALRRSKSKGDAESSKTINCDNIFIDVDKREATLDGAPLKLTFSEFEVLKLLASHPGWVYTRSQIVNEIKGDDYPVTERSIDVQIVGLRKKLGEFGSLIETIRGVGYRFRSL